MHERRLDRIRQLHTQPVQCCSDDRQRLPGWMWIDDSIGIIVLVYLCKWILRVCERSMHKRSLVDERQLCINLVQ